MLTPDQQKWIDHLSDTNAVDIVPYDKRAPEIFERVRRRIAKEIGETYLIEHHGASGLKISGQDEIDVYIPVSARDFDGLVLLLGAFLGEPRSMYPGRRARFALREAGKRVDIFPINKECDDWKNLVLFESALRNNPKILDEYRSLKEAGNGLSVREYYRRKIEFMNSVLL